MTREELFLAGYDNFQPHPSYSPDNIPYYRTFAGLRDAWGDEFCKAHNALYQQAATWNRPDRDTAYRNAINILRDWKFEKIAKPYHEIFYESEPAVPTEKDARRYFNEAFRSKFPNERVNSKHANSLWLEKCDAAMSAVRADYEQSLEERNKRKAAVDARNAQADREYENRVSDQEALRAQINAIIAEYDKAHATKQEGIFQ
ncbi:MAG: hypothetical protein M1378_11920 [Bacteroidetes bacterium]|nr:hypothetical protein [Bacteroidota bacterium]